MRHKRACRRAERRAWRLRHVAHRVCAAAGLRPEARHCHGSGRSHRHAPLPTNARVLAHRLACRAFHKALFRRARPALGDHRAEQGLCAARARDGPSKVRPPSAPSRRRFQAPASGRICPPGLQRSAHRSLRIARESHRCRPWKCRLRHRFLATTSALRRGRYDQPKVQTRPRRQIHCARAEELRHRVALRFPSALRGLSGPSARISHRRRQSARGQSARSAGSPYPSLRSNPDQRRGFQRSADRRAIARLRPKAPHPIPPRPSHLAANAGLF